MGKKAEEQGQPKRLTQLGAAIRIGAFGGTWGAALLTFVYVTQLSLAGKPNAGEAGVLVWPLAIILALIGIPLGLAGRSLSVLIRFQIDGTVRGAQFGGMLGLICAATIFITAMNFADQNKNLKLSELFFPLVGLWAGYIIAGARVGSKLKQE